MRLAHCSDIHFWHFNLSPIQFFSKQWVGNFHALLTRRKVLDPELAYKVIFKLQELKVTHLLITGDFTSSSSSQEFNLAKKYLKFLENQGITSYILPGNHDAYTKRFVKEQRFYKQFAAHMQPIGDLPFNLENDRVAAYKLTGNWWLILIDCAIANGMRKANGLFDEKTEANLQKLLKQLPDQAQIMVANHFPCDLYAYPQAHLKRGDALKIILEKDPRVKLFLHGHRHQQRCEELNPFTIDSGSISHKKESSFTLFDLDERSCHIQPFRFESSDWQPLPFTKTLLAGESHA